MKNYLTNLLILEQSIVFFFSVAKVRVFLLQAWKNYLFLHNTLCNRFQQAKIIKYSRFLFADQ